MTDYRGGGMASMKIRQIEKDVEKMRTELEEKKKEMEKVEFICPFEVSSTQSESFDDISETLRKGYYWRKF